MKIVLLIAMALGLGACWKNEQAVKEPAQQAITLESYTVPSGMESELRSALKSMFYKSEIGKVSSLPGGRLLVAAPPAFQKGVKGLVKELSSNPPVKETNIRLSIWYVAGKPGKHPHVFQDLPTNLKNIKESLKAIHDSQGFSEFYLLEELQNIAKNGWEVKTRGSFLEVKNTSRIYDDHSNLRIKVHTPINEMESNFLIKPGQTIILGKMGFPDKKGDWVKEVTKALGDFISEGDDTAEMSFFYLVRAEFLD